MTNLQAELRKACRELQLRIVVPFNLKIDDKDVHAQALVPELGGRNGMIVVTRFDELQGLGPKLLELGYGYTVLEEPFADEEFDLTSYAEMFSDWGWGAEGKRPDWMIK